MTSLEDLDTELKPKVDFIIEEGEIKANPSEIIDLTEEKPVIKTR